MIRYFLALVPFFLCFVLVSCWAEQVDFTPSDMKWFQAFQKDTTLVFTCKEGLNDTVTFYQAQVSYAKTRNLEQGFYNTKGGSVKYTVTPGSFHQPVQMEGVELSPESFVALSKSSDSKAASGEIKFLGLIFDVSGKDNFLLDTAAVVVFREEKARYAGMNWKEYVSGFEFDTTKGIISYWDKEGHRWFRSE